MAKLTKTQRKNHAEPSHHLPPDLLDAVDPEVLIEHAAYLSRQNGIPLRSC